MKPANSLSERQYELLRCLLHNKDGLTIEEVAAMLSISRNAVVQHINALTASGYIDSSLRPSTGGRPSRIYMLSASGSEVFPRHYALFSKVLLELLEQSMGDEAIAQLMQNLGDALAAEYSQKIPATLSLPEKVAMLREIMYELGYETRLEQPGSADEIIADNCVFHQLANKSEQVCQLDLQLMKNLTGATVDHVECMVRGGKCCRFKIHQ